MRKLISKETKSNLVKLGIYQIIGGVIGLLLMLWNINYVSQVTLLTLPIFILIALFFGYSIFCGIICIKSRKYALSYSLVNQILQVIGFAFGGYAFKYIAGIYISIELDLTNSTDFSLDFGVSNCKIYINSDSELSQFSFNIVAIILIYWIDRLMNIVKKEAAQRQINSLGEN